MTSGIYIKWPNYHATPTSFRDKFEDSPEAISAVALLASGVRTLNRRQMLFGKKEKTIE